MAIGLIKKHHPICMNLNYELHNMYQYNLSHIKTQRIMAGLSCELVIVIESLSITVVCMLCTYQRICYKCNKLQWVPSIALTILTSNSTAAHSNQVFVYIYTDGPFNFHIYDNEFPLVLSKLLCKQRSTIKIRWHFE